MIEDQNVLKLDAMETARRIGYVSQYQEPGRLTAFDAILMGRRPHIRWRVSDQDLRIVDGAIKSLHLQASHHAVHRPHERRGAAKSGHRDGRWCRSPGCCSWTNPPAAWT